MVQIGSIAIIKVILVFLGLLCVAGVLVVSVWIPLFYKRWLEHFDMIWKTSFALLFIGYLLMVFGQSL